MLSVNVSCAISDSAAASIYALPIYWASFSFSFFINMINRGQGKVGFFDYQSGKIQGIVREFYFSY